MRKIRSLRSEERETGNRLSYPYQTPPLAASKSRVLPSAFKIMKNKVFYFLPFIAYLITLTIVTDLFNFALLEESLIILFISLCFGLYYFSIIFIKLTKIKIKDQSKLVT